VPATNHRAALFAGRWTGPANAPGTRLVGGIDAAERWRALRPRRHVGARHFGGALDACAAIPDGSAVSIRLAFVGIRDAVTAAPFARPPTAPVRRPAACPRSIRHPATVSLWVSTHERARARARSTSAWRMELRWRDRVRPRGRARSEPRADGQHD